MKLKRGDKVVVIAGKGKGSKGKILVCDRKNNKVIVEGINKVTKHQKPGRGTQGGIVEKEAPLDASNVMYLADGKPTRIGYKVETIVENGKKKTVKTRIAKSTGEEID
ncbi:MAG: 50S ribosomal protein L24 [Clostridiales bacterium]|nr:50S ribosomal protein L24 [Clostridiales bacterium]